MQILVIVSVAEQVVLGLTLLETKQSGFLASRPVYKSINIENQSQCSNLVIAFILCWCSTCLTRIFDTVS